MDALGRIFVRAVQDCRLLVWIAVTDLHGFQLSGSCPEALCSRKNGLYIWLKVGNFQHRQNVWCKLWLYKQGSKQNLLYIHRSMLAAASAAMKAEGHMSYEEFCAAPVLRLEHRGRDSWGRPVYECDGRLYVDVDPRRSRQADICTKQGNAFDGEPCDPVPEGTIIEFVPARDTWNF